MNSQNGDQLKRVNSVLINIDGACQGNPGQGSLAVVVHGEDRLLLEEHVEKLDSTTTNAAEYIAALKALEIAAKYCRNEVKIFSDSKILINHLTGRYRIRHQGLLKILMEIKLMETLFRRVKYFHVARENNRRANELANKVFGEKSLRENKFDRFGVPARDSEFQV